jgi:hypothetical protein
MFCYRCLTANLVGEGDVKISGRSIIPCPWYTALRFGKFAVRDVVFEAILWEEREVPKRYCLQGIIRVSLIRKGNLLHRFQSRADLEVSKIANDIEIRERNTI